MYVIDHESLRRNNLGGWEYSGQPAYNLDGHPYRYNEGIDRFFGNQMGYWPLVEPLLNKLISPVVKSPGITSIAPAIRTYSKATHPWEAAIQIIGGRVVDPQSFPFTQAGFQSYLDATGVKHFSAKEMTTPNHIGLAHRTGFSIFLPPYKWWPRGAALAKLADMLRDLVNRPVRMRNWWRPEKYNKLVGGAKSSDHILAEGVDLDYGTREGRRKAEKFLKDFREQNPWLGMSLGLGARTTHVGLLTKRGKRTWTYKSYRS